MLFNLNDFLRGVSNAIDVIETDIFGVPTNHSKRIAYLSLKISQELAFNSEEIFDLVSLSMLHDNGASLKVLQDKLRGNTQEKLNLLESMQEHCEIGEENIRPYPFLTMPQNIIKYHHERYDGTGFFGLSGDHIPIMSQIINFSDTLDLNFDLRNVHTNTRLKDDILDFVQNQKDKFFSPLLVKVFFKIAGSENIWFGLSDEFIDGELKAHTPSYDRDFTYAEIHDITKTFSRIIDAKSKFTQEHSSGLVKKLEKLTSLYNMDEENRMKLFIAGDLHDLGKLAISNAILDKPGNLTKEEFEEIKKHPEATRTCLQEIRGFEDITEWAANHHEKLDGTGYPRGLLGSQMDFHSRLLACLDVYQSLREDRPYRKAMSHADSMKILFKMAEDNLLDDKIVDDIDKVFSEE